MTYTYTIRWPSSASEVYVTGNFDDWSKSVVATSVVGGFAHKVEVPHRQEIVFKFVVDGEWQLNREYATRWDDGVENNVVPAEDLEEVKKEETTSEKKSVQQQENPTSESEFKSTPVQPVPGVISIPIKRKEHKEEATDSEKKTEEKPEFKSTPTQPVPGVISIPIKRREHKEGAVETDEKKEKSEFKSTPTQPVPGVISIPIKRKEHEKEAADSEKKTEEKSEFKSTPTQPVPGVISIPISREHKKEATASEKDKEAPVPVSKESKEAFNSPSPDDDVLSDFDESVASASSGNPKSHEEEEHPSLNQVLTSTSSFAAVSLPSSTDEYHDIGNVHDEPPDEDQFNTPTNSLFNSTVLPAKGDLPESAETQTSSPSLQKSTPESSLSSSRNNSFNKPPLKTHDSAATIPKKDNIVAILKAPGSYPSETTSSTPREEQYTGKRENLVSKFKGLFRY